jgi:outer membrane protein
MSGARILIRVPVARRLRQVWIATLTGAAALAQATPGMAAPAAAASLTVEQAVEVALRANPRLAAARARVEASDERTGSSARRMLPAVRLSEELQFYDKAFSIGFAGAPGTTPAVFPVRDRTTNSFVASVEEPLLGLLRLNSEREAQGADTDAARARIASAEADLRAAVETQFLRYFEARALAEIADTSARELGAEVEVARARLTSGVITNADLLRLQVAVANARQQSLQAGSQASVSHTTLFALLGYGPEQGEVTFIEPRNLLAAARPAPPRMDALLPSARARRPELVERLRLVDAAESQARARAYALLPDVNAEAAYLRIDGQPIAAKNSAYVGLKAQWAIWEWGASDHLRRAAEAEATAAQRDLEDTNRQIESDLATSLAQGDAARGAVEAAETAITSAEEAFRVTQAQVKAGSATTTDLLEAESALTQARLNLTRAQYELALAHVALARATGT